MNAVTLYFTPQELAHVRGVDILQIFKEIKNHTLPAIMTDKGLRIPITYQVDKQEIQLAYH